MAQDATSPPSTSAGDASRHRSRQLIEAGTDREAAFRKARRHTLLVRTLRIVLPASALLMLASYGLFMQRTLSFAWGTKKVEVTGLSINREALVAHNPRYSGFDKNGGEFEVKAATAEQDLKQKTTVRLKTIEGRMTDTGRQTTTLRSPRGTMDTNTNVLDLYERIDVTSQNGMSAALTRATIFAKEGRIVSDEPVVVTMPTGSVRGNAMTIEQRQKRVLFSGGVVTSLLPQSKPATAGPASPALRGSQAQAGIGRSDAPVDITSRRLLIDDATKLATFSGGVVAKQADSVMETAELEVTYEGHAAAAAAQPAAPGASAPRQPTDQQSRLRKLVTRSEVVLTRGLETAKGSAGEFDAVEDKAILMGPVVISAGPDRGATADRAELDNKRDSILLTGNVVVTQQKNMLRGRRLQADRKNGTMQLSSPPNAGLPKGQIHATLYQQEGEGAAAKKPATSNASTKPAAAPAVQPMLLGTSMRGDPSQPIEIDADVLDVDDRKKVAIFRGRVRAVQGEYTIVTEELQASYTGEAGMALGAAPAGKDSASAAPSGAQAAAQPKAGAQLRTVSAPRKVQIVAKDGQRASGDSAIFDPKANTARLSGNVVLSKGTSVTSGNCAIFDLNSGQMSLVDACGYSQSAPSSTPAGAVARSPVGPGRAQAVLFPGQMKDEQNGKQSPPEKPARPPATAAKSPESAEPPKLKPPRPTKVEDAKSSLFGN